MDPNGTGMGKNASLGNDTDLRATMTLQSGKGRRSDKARYGPLRRRAFGSASSPLDTWQDTEVGSGSVWLQLPWAPSQPPRQLTLEWPATSPPPPRPSYLLSLIYLQSKRFSQGVLTEWFVTRCQWEVSVRSPVKVSRFSLCVSRTLIYILFIWRLFRVSSLRFLLFVCLLFLFLRRVRKLLTDKHLGID